MRPTNQQDQRFQRIWLKFDYRDNGSIINNLQRATLRSIGVLRNANNWHQDQIVGIRRWARQHSSQPASLTDPPVRLEMVCQAKIY